MRYRYVQRKQYTKDNHADIREMLERSPRLIIKLIPERWFWKETTFVKVVGLVGSVPFSLLTIIILHGGSNHYSGFVVKCEF